MFGGVVATLRASAAPLCQLRLSVEQEEPLTPHTRGNYREKIQKKE